MWAKVTLHISCRGTHFSISMFTHSTDLNTLCDFWGSGRWEWCKVRHWNMACDFRGGRLGGWIHWKIQCFSGFDFNTHFYSLVFFVSASDLPFSCQSLALHHLPAWFWSCDGRTTFWSHFQVKETSQNNLHGTAQCFMHKRLHSQVACYNSGTLTLIDFLPHDYGRDLSSGCKMPSVVQNQKPFRYVIELEIGFANWKGRATSFSLRQDVSSHIEK